MAALLSESSVQGVVAASSNGGHAVHSACPQMPAVLGGRVLGPCPGSALFTDDGADVDGPSLTDLMGRTTCPPTYQPPLRSNLLTVVFPGFLASRGQASKYTGPDPVLVTDRETGAVVARVVCAHAPRLLHNVHPLPDVDEQRTEPTLNPLRWLTMAKSLAVRHFFRMPDLPLSHVTPGLNNLGGFADQAACRRYIADAIAALDAEDSANTNNAGEAGKKRPRRQLVLFGFSRGATTMMYTALSLPPAMAARVGLLILEAPFDTVEGVLRDSSYVPTVALAALRNIGHYSGPGAYVMPNETHLTCPVAFITSAVDTRVPPHTTERCIAEMARRYPHLTLERLRLRHCRHPLFSIGDDRDRTRYTQFMEHLYDTYLPQQ